MSANISPILTAITPPTEPATTSFLFNLPLSLPEVVRSVHERATFFSENVNLSNVHLGERIVSFVDFDTGRAYLKIFNGTFFPI